ncbi:hypothetical protein [Methylobacterium brachiatum]|jgi:hypothetical protein|uniref:hypothetical protein n=1 Tax=Methylobacterium brachiatum TaxID=269660 RepID=UPI000EFCDBC7|nr:hypothetical protein [Methylobacterium brachiatum]AYO83125.1 hypothetical protein EBB05_13205 [Methylobacterium brachiatum]
MIPRRIPLAGPSIAPPALFYSSTDKRRGVVTDGIVTVCGAAYRVLGPDVPEGELVEVHPQAFAFRVSEILAMEAAAAAANEKRRADEEAVRHQRADLDRAESEAANAGLDLRFTWEAAIRTVASGLSSRGAGNGVNARSVVHVRCDEPVAVGRLRRSVGDLLCGAGDGAMDYLAKAVSVDGSGRLYRARVTCRACRAAALRLAATR